MRGVGTHFDSPLYIAGPMTHRPAFNYPAFDAAAADLRSRGYFVISPAEIVEPNVRRLALASPDGDPRSFLRECGLPWSHFIQRNIKIVAEQVGGLILLPEWKSSYGTLIEVMAGITVKLPIYVYPELDEIEVRFEALSLPASS